MQLHLGAGLGGEEKGGLEEGPDSPRCSGGSFVSWGSVEGNGDGLCVGS